MTERVTASAVATTENREVLPGDTAAIEKTRRIRNLVAQFCDAVLNDETGFEGRMAINHLRRDPERNRLITFLYAAAKNPDAYFKQGNEASLLRMIEQAKKLADLARTMVGLKNGGDRSLEYLTLEEFRKRNQGSSDYDYWLSFHSVTDERLKEYQNERAEDERYLAAGPIGPGISAAEVLQDPEKFAAFERLMSRYSNGRSPISAREFLEVCQEHDIEPALALAQAICESNIGTAGRAVRTHNIFNVGNTDDGSAQYESSWISGMKTYCRLMRRSYGNTLEECVQRDFCRVRDGARYATSSAYTRNVSAMGRRIQAALQG